MPALTKETLQKHMRYDQESGHLIWVVPTGHRAKAGRSAGVAQPAGYGLVAIFGKRYLIHHLVWLYHHGELPPKHLDIDHKDGDRTNSRIENLRLVSRTENLAGGRAGVIQFFRGSCRPRLEDTRQPSTSTARERILVRLIRRKRPTRCIRWLM